MKTANACLAILTIAWAFAASPAHAQETRVSGGVNVRLVSGTFGGSQTTTILYAPAVVRLDVGRFEFAGFFPYLSVHNGAGALSDGGWIPLQGSVSGAPDVGVPMGGGMTGGGMMGGAAGQPTGTPSAPTSGATFYSASGIGDVVGSAGYCLIDNVLTGTQVVFSARVKVPTASAASGLGTGRMDVGAAAAIRKQFASGWLYGEVGYLKVGRPSGADLRNSATWSVGGGRRLAPRIFLLASAFGNTAALRRFDSPAEVGAGIGIRLAERLNVTAIPSVGLTHASPRYGMTLGLSTELWRR